MVSGGDEIGGKARFESEGFLCLRNRIARPICLRRRQLGASRRNACRRGGACGSPGVDGGSGSDVSGLLLLLDLALIRGEILFQLLDLSLV